MSRLSRQVLIITVIFVSVGQMAMALYLPALPVLAASLHISAGLAQLSLTLFLLAFGISQLFYGVMSDRYGRKPMLVLGLLITLFGAALVIASHHLHTLLIARIIQGFGAGSVSVLARSIIRDHFDGSALTKGMSYLVMSAAITPAVSPFIGGHLQQWFGWRGIFVAYFIYSLSIVFVVLRWLPETLAHERRQHIRFATVVSNFKQVLQHSSYRRYVSCIVLAYSSQVLYLSISPFIFQGHLHVSASAYGTLITIPAVGYFIGSVLTNRLAGKYSLDQLLVAGTVLVSLAGLALVIEQLFHWVGVADSVILLTLLTVGIGLIYPNAISGMLTPFHHMAGSASALAGFLQMTLSSALASLASLFHIESPLGLGMCLAVCGMLMYFIFAVLPLRHAWGTSQPAVKSQS